MSTSRRPPLTDDLLATLALCAYSLAVAVGFARVFSGWAFMPELAAVAIVGHGTSFGLRRARVSGWIAVPIMALVLTWLLSIQHYRDTMSVPIPWASTWDRFRFDLGLVRDEFPTAIAPVLYDVVGWAMLAGIAMALVVVLSDSFAFRAEARGEALVPGGVLFVFVAALGSPRLRIGSTILLIAAGVVAVIALRRLHDRDRATLVTSRRRTVPLAVPAALATALGIALIAGFVGPRLPGAHAEPLYDTKGRGGTNFITSPLVDIRSRLTNRGNVELFRVNADEPRYWRSITLAEFNGEQFRLPERPLERIDEAEPVADDDVRIRQQVQILALGGELVPAAADPRQASGTHPDGTDFKLSQQQNADTLIAPEELTPGDLIDVVSFSPSPTPDELRAAGVGNVPDPIYLELPDNLPEVVYTTTEVLTAGQPTPYDEALALQSWFRDQNQFTYSTEVQSGHGSNAIESFFRVRAGYCEQFAASFAAMARIAGIPSRVAVGFTPGVLEDGWYSVIGKNSHAWPELWFDGIGWVAFEPTPDRGAPGAESYTGVAAQQDTSGLTGSGSRNGDQTQAPPVPPTVVPAGASADTTPFDPGDEIPRDFVMPSLRDGIDGLGGTEASPGGGGSGTRWLLTATVILAAVAVAPWATRRVMRFRHRHRGPREQITFAWARARDAARDAGVAGTPAMTPTEWSDATASVIPVAVRPMRSLAQIVDRVMYAPADEVDLERRGSFGDRVSDDCELWANQVQRIVDDTLTTPARIRRYFTTFR